MFRYLKERRMKRGRKGFSLIESVMAIAIVSVIMGAFLPKFTTAVKTYKRDGVTDRISSDIRKVRAQAIATGWNYRIIGISYGATSAYKNQYRVMARSSSAIAWPADNVAVMQTATQMAGPWSDINKLFPGVQINPSDTSAHFSVAFDSRGVRIEMDANFNPLTVVGQAGANKSLTISTAGNVHIQ